MKIMTLGGQRDKGRKIKEVRTQDVLRQGSKAVSTCALAGRSVCIAEQTELPTRARVCCGLKDIQGHAAGCLHTLDQTGVIVTLTLNQV